VRRCGSTYLPFFSLSTIDAGCRRFSTLNAD
jgi:hypothetical protein